MSGTSRPELMSDDPFVVIATASAALKARREDLENQVQVRAGKPYAAPSASTIIDYEKEAKRLLASGDPWGEAAKTTKRATWLKRKSALLFVAGRQIENLLKAQNELQRTTDTDHEAMYRWAGMLMRLHRWTQVLTTKPLTDQLAKVDRRQSKRAGLSRLPDDWREQLCTRLPNWRMPYLVCACTGARPVEISHGIQLHIEGQVLIIRIKGAKLGKYSGQEARELRWPIQKGMPPLVRQLTLAVHEAGGRLIVDYSGRTNPNPQKAFSGAMRQAAKRAFPGHKFTLTPYSLRHSAASDLKDSDLSDAQQSAALGHQVVETKRTYGHRALSRGRSVAPQKVRATSQVRGDPTRPPWAPPARVTERPKTDPGPGHRR